MNTPLPPPVGFVVYRSAAKAAVQWSRTVKLAETKTFVEACIKAVAHSKKINGETRVFPVGADPRNGANAWAVAWYGETIHLRHGPSMRDIIARAAAAT
jgi:hypothetical protein